MWATVVGVPMVGIPMVGIPSSLDLVSNYTEVIPDKIHTIK